MADLAQEFIHPLGVHLKTDHPVQLTLTRADGAVNIDELPFVTIAHTRTQRRRCPTTSQPYHPPKPRFILENHSDIPALDNLWFQDGRQHFRKFFFQSSWACGSLLGCRVSGATFRQPCRARNRYTTELATGRPNRCAKAARMGETTSTPPALACSAHGCRKARSASESRRARRRPPHDFRRFPRPCRRHRNRACSLGTVARPTPSSCAVFSNVAANSAGNRMAMAWRYSSRSRVRWVTWCAWATNLKSICRGLAITTI